MQIIKRDGRITEFSAAPIGQTMTDGRFFVRRIGKTKPPVQLGVGKKT